MRTTIRVSTLAKLVTAAAIGVAATLTVTQAWRVGAAPGDIDSTFVPVTPCRLFDLRPAPNTVGPRPAPLAAGEVFTQQVTGSNGNCTGALAIPTSAVAVAMNVTAVNPTAQSNLRVYPANLATVPTVSNLNFSAGQKPVPNKVDVKLSPDGKIKLYNQAGTVSVVGDVVGYYTKSSLTELNNRIATLESTQPFAESAFASEYLELTVTPTSVLDITVTAPATGVVTINWSAYAVNFALGAEVACAPVISTAIPATVYYFDEGSGIWETASAAGDEGTLSGTRGFDIAAGTTVTYSLACHEYTGSGSVAGRTMTAIFTPSP